MLLYGTINQTDKGRAWRVGNTTVGTGIAAATGTTFSDTSAIFTLFNNVTTQNPPGKILYFDYLKLICTAAGTGSTSFQVALALDTAARGMGTATGSVTFNADSDTIGSVAPPIPAGTTVGVSRFGALTPSAATANRAIIGRSAIKTQAAPCLAVGDEYLIIANGEEQGFGPLSGTAAARFVMPTGVISIGPGGLFLVHAWFPGNTGAASFEYEAQYWELS